MKYKKVLLKFSGEALCNPGENGNFNRESLEYIANEIKDALEAFPELGLGLMPGGGNHGRGSELIHKYKFRQRAAHGIGMTYTIVNAVAMRSVFQDILPERDIRIMSALSFPYMGEDYLPEKAVHHMNEGRLVIFAAGSGRGCQSTDSAAVNRAAELEMDAVLKGTKERGVFDCDPRENDCAEFLPRITNKEFVAKDLKKIFDPPAVTDAEEQGLPIHVFNIFEKGNLVRLLSGEDVGTCISPRA